MTNAQAVRDRVLQAISLNRIPGYHFPAHLLQLSFDHVATERTLISLDPGPHCLNTDNEVHIGATALLIDLSLSASIRAGLHPAQRLGTVNMTIQFTQAPGIGRLESEASFQDFLHGALGKQGVSRYTLRSNGRTIGAGSGSFMVLDPPKGVTMHPVMLRRRGEPLPETITPAALTDPEREILAAADQAIDAANAEGDAFIDHFWGIRASRTEDGAMGEVWNGRHACNRVGHSQGGLLFGYAARSASAALEFRTGSPWRLSSLAASYVSPGEGERLAVRSTILHQGRLTALVRTSIVRPDGKLSLELTSHHAAA